MGDLTHVFYAFATPRADGAVELPGERAVLADLVQRAHSERVSVSLSVGGWMNGDPTPFVALAAAPESRARFARELRELVDEFRLDGVDVDWEYPEAAVATSYTALIRDVHAALSPDTQLTAAVGPDERSTGGITQDVLPLLSFVAIMAYDADSVEHAPLWLAESALDHWRNKGASTDKLVLGVPLYSRPAFLPFWEIVQRDPSNADRDELRGESYNGRRTIIAKTRLAMERASGVMAWELGQDARGEYSLIRTIASTARGEE
jgi:GH18 family chitinase